MVYLFYCLFWSCLEKSALGSFISCLPHATWWTPRKNYCMQNSVAREKTRKNSSFEDSKEYLWSIKTRRWRLWFRIGAKDDQIFFLVVFLVGSVISQNQNILTDINFINTITRPLVLKSVKNCKEVFKLFNFFWLMFRGLFILKLRLMLEVFTLICNNF